ncbi:MAG: F0F1 ATP synthase subunit epsilon [Hyphomicrobiaceae bacterium]
MADTFKFELVSPEKLLMSEDVMSVLVPGSEGEFTVFAHHAPVLSTMRAGLLDVTLPDGGKQRIFIRGGFAEVQPDNLTVLAQQAINLDELDRDWLAQEIRNTEEDVADAKDEDVRTAAQNTLRQLQQVAAAAGHA